LDLDPLTPLPDVDNLSAAFVDLSYEHGFPTIPSGQPFWTKLEFEPGLAYGCFQIYLELIQVGPRELEELAKSSELQTLFSQHLNSTVTQAELTLHFQEYYALYAWKHRAKAYDLFKEAAYRHERVRRAMRVEDEHFHLASQMMEKLKPVILDGKFLENLSPRLLLEALGKVIAIQRISSGLPASGPLTQKEIPEATNFELIMREVIQKQQASAQQSAPIDITESAKDGALEKLLKDPTSTRSMQELIIRVTKFTQESNQDPRGPQGRGRTYEHNELSIEDDEESSLP
jgi:hypothetical protein